MNNLGIPSLEKNSSPHFEKSGGDKIAFLIIDVQERFLPVIENIDQVISNINILTKVSETLNIPLIVTEQYPQGLGNTTEKINLAKDTKIIEKTSFSCFGSEEFTKLIEDLKIDTLVISGIESHVCVLQTILDALDKNIQVHLITDAISSRTLENKNIALERIKQSGAFISSTEMISFQLLKQAGTDEFKTISKLFK